MIIMTASTLLIEKESVDISLKDVLIFAGYRTCDKDSPVSEEYKRRAKDALSKIKQVFTPKACFIRSDIEKRGEDFVEVLGMRLESKPLSELLSPCKEVFLFAVTAGPFVDREISKMRFSPVDEILYDAAGSAAAEALCDEAERQLSSLAGKKLCQRFSPGYSGLSIDCQADFLRVLEAGKRAGIYLTKGNMMAPLKSVTAILGIPEKEGEERTLY